MKEIYERRSVRSFKRMSVEPEKQTALLKAAMAAPSAGNGQPWEFITVENPTVLKTLSQASPYAGCTANAPLAIVLLADKTRSKFPVCWQQDMGAAAENILLEAVSLELGAVWLGIAPEEDRMENIRRIFNLSENYLPFCIIACGYPSEQTKPADRFDEKKIHHEHM